MKYHIVTFGCQVNHSDSERIASVLETMGYQKTLKIQEADLVVINACSVRQSATDRILGQKPKIKKTAQTILTGCLVAQDKKKLTSHFDFILNIQDLSQWPKIITNSTPAIQAKPSKLSCNYLKIQPNYQTWPIAYVPISSGCNNFCAYCCVPYTRGREVSRSASEIVREVKNLIQQNYKEIWLLGQNVNSYRFQNTNFPKLLEKINKLKGDFWIRFTSPHPKDFSDELITQMATCSKVTPYLNLPIQAGDDVVLKKMNRPYTIKHYKNLVAKIKKAIPDITLSTDIIVGFPSETKKQFNNSLKLFRELKFAMAYISQFSPRPGTTAAKLKDNVLSSEKASRAEKLITILKKTALADNQRFLGQTVKVLPISFKNGYLTGKSLHYKTIMFKGQPSLIGQFCDVKVTRVTNFRLFGEYE